jgi:deazaflavin-dependent oxidoreductase (nitroreductase family)
VIVVVFQAGIQEEAMWFDPLMKWLLRSPFHGMISKGVMLVSVRGRKSGKTISTPTNYVREGNMLWVISWRDRKWWRNLRGGADVRLRLAGKEVRGCGRVIEEQKAVGQSLIDYYRRVPNNARYVGIGLDPAGLPRSADCERAAQRLVVVRIDLQ